MASIPLSTLRALARRSCKQVTVESADCDSGRAYVKVYENRGDRTVMIVFGDDAAEASAMAAAALAVRAAKEPR